MRYVTVPPDRMEIMDLATGRQLLRRQDGDDGANRENDRSSSEASTATTTTVVGPYVEGSNVRVRCRVYGGKSDTGLLNRKYSEYSLRPGWCALLSLGIA